MAELGVTVAGVRFRNPVLLASGILDETGASMRRVWELGAGGVVTKSVGLEPRAGHPNPTVVEVGCGLLNAMGLPNPGFEEYRREVEEAVSAGAPVVLSIFGSSPEEFARLAEMAAGLGVVALELNMSCPHASGYGLEVGSDPAMVEEVVRAVRGVSGLPVFVKLSPHLSDLRPFVSAVESAGGDGFVAINTLRGMAIDVETGFPVLGNRVGGYSGPGIKPVGVRFVYELRRLSHLPVVGVGGVLTGRDALEYMMAGASLVQVGTAVYYRGPGAPGMVAEEMGELLDRLGYGGVGEVVGLAHRRGGEGAGGVLSDAGESGGGGV